MSIWSICVMSAMMMRSPGCGGYLQLDILGEKPLQELSGFRYHVVDAMRREVDSLLPAKSQQALRKIGCFL